MKFKDAFINKIRTDVLNKIDAVQIKVDAEWKTGRTESKSVSGDTLTVIASFPQYNESEIYIESSRIIDADGTEIAIQDECYNKIKGHGLLINITIPIKEVEEDV